MKRRTRDDYVFPNHAPITPLKHKRNRLNRFLLGAILSGGLMMQASACYACDYCDSVEPDCVACETSCDEVSCDSIGGRRRKGRCRIFLALDAIAGGIEKVMGFDKCGQTSGGCDTASCGCCECPPPVDNGCGCNQCGAVSGGHSMPDANSYLAPQPTYSSPRIQAPPVSTPRMSTPRAGSTASPLRMSQPTIVSPQATSSQPSSAAAMPFHEMQNNPGTSLDVVPRATTPRTTTPRTTPRTTTPRTPSVPVPPQRVPNGNGGGLFDALDDPFSDDARVIPQYRPRVFPSNYRPTPLTDPVRLGYPQASVDRPQPNENRLVRQATARQATARQATARQATVQQAAAPLRSGRSFRSYDEAGLQPGTATRQVSHQQPHSQAYEAPPEFEPAPRPVNRPEYRPTPVRQRNLHQVNPRPTSTRSAASRPVVRPASHPVVRPAPTAVATPVRRMNGQRHSLAPYASSYGHTTNRR